MSIQPELAQPEAATDPLLLERLRAAAELLETVAADMSLLAGLPAADRHRLQRAVAQVYHPDPVARRRRLKAAERARTDAQIRNDDALLDSTGIRTLRRKPVFTTPNYFPPGRSPSALEAMDGREGPLGGSPGAAETMDDREGPPGRSPGAAETMAGRKGPPADFSAQDRDGDDQGRRETIEPQHCYVCKQKYSLIHHFYDQLCPGCAEFNFRKRSETADLRGRVALLTGGRVKIGYQAGIKLLRAGAQLIVTTRFPRDSAARYAAEPDFSEWGHRLEIFGLDLRHTPSVEAFCQTLVATRPRLDFIINNACQTVRRPPAFYAHMMAAETAAAHAAPESVRRLLGAYEGLRGPELLGAGAAMPASHSVAAPGLTRAAELSQVPLLAEELLGQQHLFPEGRLDQDLQQLDLRGRNSWRMLMHEVPSVELLEVQLVNAVAPFIINARLKPLLLKTPERDKHIVNVSAVEGQFYRNFKTTKHPHTNMAKAALNMMTRTAATDYHGDGIHMNSVDTGWVTDEDPVEIAARKTREERFHPPLDIVDGAARIVDPIIAGINSGEHVWGQFLKDYRPTDW